MAFLRLQFGLNSDIITLCAMCGEENGSKKLFKMTKMRVLMAFSKKNSKKA
jgi:hypothetical protein